MLRVYFWKNIILAQNFIVFFSNPIVTHIFEKAIHMINIINYMYNIPYIIAIMS